jgi:hypothetical protein
VLIAEGIVVIKDGRVRKIMSVPRPRPNLGFVPGTAEIAGRDQQ